MKMQTSAINSSTIIKKLPTLQQVESKIALEIVEKINFRKCRQ